MLLLGYKTTDMNPSDGLTRIVDLFCNVLLECRSHLVPNEQKKSGITKAIAQGLLFLNNHRGCSIGNLARGLNVSHPAAVRLTARLIDKGLVKKNECRSDKRVSLLALTPNGEKIAKAIKQTQTRPIFDALRQMAVSEQDSLKNGLEKLITGMVNDADMIRRVCLKCGKRHEENCIINRKHLALTGRHIQST